MARVLSIYLPQWDVEWIGRQSSDSKGPWLEHERNLLASPLATHLAGALGAARRPTQARKNKKRTVLLIAPHAGQQLVVRCCGQAQAAGVAPGMTLAEARALCPGAIVLTFDAARSRRGLELLAHWCLKLSPVASVDPTGIGTDGLPDGLLVDLTGMEYLAGRSGFSAQHADEGQVRVSPGIAIPGRVALKLYLMEIAARFERMGFTARLAAAPTIGAAWALARFGPYPLSMAEPAQVRAALEPLPLAALRVETALHTTLAQMGIERVAHLLALPRESLLTRFGSAVLRRIDQALGRAIEKIAPIHPEPPLEVRRAFDGATTQLEAIVLATQELIAELSAQLAARESGVRGLRLELQRVDAAPHSCEIVLGRPRRDARHLWKLLRPKVEAAHLGHGVEGLRLAALWIQRIRHEQAEAWERQAAADADVEEMLNTLINRWGQERVLAPRVAESHTPELARQYQPVLAAQMVPSRQCSAEARLVLADRPTVLLEHPEPAEAVALLPDHPPAWLRWRGQEHQLTAGAGLERIVTAWWAGALASTRDYFKVQTQDGCWLWVFRQTDSGQWYVHGLWA